MELAVQHHIQVIGQDFDQGIFPNILDGGVLIPGARPVVPVPGKERVHHGQQSRQTNPSCASTPSGTSAASGYPGTSGNTAPVARATTCMEEEIDVLKRSYPGTRSYPQAHGVWLQIPCAVLPNLGYSAKIIVAINTSLHHVSAWGFWVAGVAGIRWIGDRHTNYADGSICAFDGRDGTWHLRESLVKLADIYSMWAFRHLHLEVCGHWPGPQSSGRRLERMREFKPNENCGCDAPRGTYAECCMAADIAAESTPGRMDYAKTHSNIMYALECQTRRPPSAVVELASDANGSHVFPEFTPDLVDWVTGDWLRSQARLVAQGKTIS